MKKILLLALLAGGCAGPRAAPPAAPTPVDISPRLTEAARLVEERQYSAALDILQAAIRLDATDPQPLVARGRIYLTQHRWALAQEAFAEALAVQPLQTSAYTATVGLAEALLEQGEPIQSRNVWRQAIELDESRPEGWTGLGRAYLAALDYRPAAQAFSAALTHDSSPEALWYLAALTLPADAAKGTAYLKRIAPLAPAGDYLLATLEPLTPSSSQAEAAALVGVALLQLDEPELAHNALSTAAQLAPTNAKTWAFLGYAQAKLGLPAMKSFDQATTLDPTLALTPYFEGIYLRQKGLHGLAIEYFLDALDLDPGNLAVALETALTLAEKGDYQSAEAWYRSAAEAEPDSAEYQRLLTEFYVNRSYRVAENGLAAAERLVELAPDDAKSYDLLGWARYQTGDFAGAEEALHQAVALAPASVPARYHLGKTLEALHKDSDAQVEFTRAADWDTSGVYRKRILGE